MIETLAPRLLINRPIEAVVMPLPTDDATPPVTKMYFGMSPLSTLQLSAISRQHARDRQFDIRARGGRAGVGAVPRKTHATNPSPREGGDAGAPPPIRAVAFAAVARC